MRVLAVVTAALAAALVCADVDVSAMVHQHRVYRESCAAGNTDHCNTESRHAAIIKAADTHPNQWNTPVLAGPDKKKRNQRHRKHVEADGTVVWAHIGMAKSFVGMTPYGFLDHTSDVTLKNTTVLVEDFMPEVLASDFHCAALAAADGSPADHHTRPFHLLASTSLIMNPVLLTMKLPASDGDLDFGLLRERWVLDNSLVFGGDVFVEHADFAPGASCGVQIPFDSPYFTIIAAEWSHGDRRLRLALVPTTFQDLHLAAFVNHTYYPDGEAEVARRVKAGENVGDVAALDAFRSSRRLGTWSDKGEISINWNKKTGAEAAAATDSIDIIKGFITCKGCYAYLTATVSITLNMCVEVGFSSPVGTYLYYYDSSFGDKMKEYTGKDTVPSASEDCKALNQKLPSFGANIAGTGAGISAGMTIDASISGNAGFSYNFQQFPFDGTKSTCKDSSKAWKTGTDTEAELCAIPLVAFSDKPVVLSLTAGGVALTVNINGQVRGAFQVTGAYDGALSFGRTWSVTDFKLGGKLTVATISSGDGSVPPVPTIGLAADKKCTICITPYNTFPTKNEVQPTKILVPTKFEVQPEAFIWVDAQISIWGTIPIVASARAHVVATFQAAAGDVPAAKVGGAVGSSVALGYQSGDKTDALKFDAKSCQKGLAGTAAQFFGSVALGIDMSVGLLSTVTLKNIKPIRDAAAAVAGSLSSLADGTLDLIKVLDPFVTSYTNLFGGATGASMFAACITLSTSRRLGEEAAPRALQSKCDATACKYNYDDTNSYKAGVAGTGGTGGASDTPCTTPQGTAISQAACTSLQALIPAGSGVSPSSVCTCGGGSSSALSGGAIAGIVIGVLAGVALIAVGGLWYMGKLPIGGDKKKPVSSKAGGSSAAKTVGGDNPMARGK